jgi:hypothetical protein
MELQFLLPKVQAVIIVDTTNDISAFIDSVGISPLEVITLLLVIIISLSAASVNPIVSQFVYLCTSIAVGLLLNANTALFPDTSSIRVMFLYVLFTTAILMFLEWIPIEIARVQLTKRTKFVLGYAAGQRIVQVFSSHDQLKLAVLFLTATFFIHRNTWIGSQSKSETSLFIRSLYTIMRQALISIAIQVFISREESGEIFQDMLYCLGIMSLVAFLTTIIHEEFWRPYALWRVADYIIRDISSIPGNSLWNLFALTISVVLLIGAIVPDYNGQYMTLAKVVAGSTFTRAVLDSAQSLPEFDLMVLRILAVVLLF